LLHGIGAHTGRWNFFAEYFSQKGISCYALELRGFGETAERPRGHLETFEIYYQDIKTMAALIGRENPGKKAFLVGESLGGLLAFVLAAREPKLFDGLIFMSPAFKNAIKFPLIDYLIMLPALLFNPQIMLAVPFTSTMCTRDLAYRQVMDSNPLELRKASVKYLLYIIVAQVQSAPLTKKIQGPVLFMLPGLDCMIDRSASRKIFKALVTQDKTLIEYPDMFHALYIDLGREKVFADILRWLENHL
jgi:alpha-beta hydrolase superfamily lysophospholipase